MSSKLVDKLNAIENCKTIRIIIDTEKDWKAYQERCNSGADLEQARKDLEQAKKEGYKTIKYVLDGDHIQKSINQINEEMKDAWREYRKKQAESEQEAAKIIFNA